MYGYGGHHLGGQSGERGVNNTKTGIYPQIQGKSKKITTTIKSNKGRRFAIDLE